MSSNHTPLNPALIQQPTKLSTHIAHSRPVESEPLSPQKNVVEIQKVVEHEVTDKHVKTHVEVRKDIPEIPPDLKNLGITTNASSSFSTYQSLKLPLEEKKLPAALHTPLTESIRWLGEFTLYLINQSQGKIQSVHQNIVQNFIRMIS